MFKRLWFDGRAGCTWGYVPGVPALQAEPLLRLAVQAELMARTDLEGLVVLGGRLSPALESHLRRYHALIFPTDPHAPVNPYRATLYQPHELYAGIAEHGYEATPDARAYHWSRDASLHHDAFEACDAVVERAEEEVLLVLEVVVQARLGQVQPPRQLVHRDALVALLHQDRRGALDELWIRNTFAQLLNGLREVHDDVVMSRMPEDLTMPRVVKDEADLHEDEGQEHGVEQRDRLDLDARLGGDEPAGAVPHADYDRGPPELAVHRGAAPSAGLLPDLQRGGRGHRHLAAGNGEIGFAKRRAAR